MKNFLLALMVVLTTCTLAIAQNQTTVVRDSVGKVKVTVTKDNKAKTNNTAVTVIGVDTADTDSTEVDANSSNISTGHGKASFTFESDDDDFPFHGFGINGGILVAKRLTHVHKASRTPLQVSVFSSSFGQSPVNSELERSVYSLHLWVSDNGSSVVNNRLKVQMLSGRILPIKMKKRIRITSKTIASKSSLLNPKRKTKE